MSKDMSTLVEKALSPDSGRPPWERLKVGRRFLESRKAFEAFVIYRDMGTSRTLLRVQTEYKKSTSVLKWSTLYKWVFRCAEYDDHMDRQYLIQLEEERREMARRHINLAKLMQHKVYKRLEKIGDKEITQITPRMIPSYLRTAIDIERMATGEPTERVDHEGSSRIVIIDDIPRKVSEQKK